MKFAIVVALSALSLFMTCSCAHTVAAAGADALPQTPPTFGFNARIRPDRKVVCLTDNDLTHAQCAEVARAVDKINAAVGFELLRTPVEVPLAETKDAGPEDEATYIVGGELAEGVLGVTTTQAYEVRTGVLLRVIVAYSTLIWSNQELRESVVLHELLHSVGGVHAGQASAFNSVEKPGWAPGAPTALTPGDVAALRAAYPRAH